MFIYSDNYKKIGRMIGIDRPLVVFNVETTGKSIAEDKIVSLAYVKIAENGLTKKDLIMIDPEIEVRREAIALHGLTNEKLNGQPNFKAKAQEIWDIFHNCRYSGYNINNFDLPILRREFVRVGMDFNYSYKDILDIKELYRFFAPHTLENAYEYYCHKELKGKKNPLAGIDIFVEILSRQLEKYKEVLDWEMVNYIHVDPDRAVDDSSESNRKFYWKGGEAYLAFSKHSGQALNEVAREDPEFIEWLAGADFSEEIRALARKSIEKNENESDNKISEEVKSSAAK